jgi:hypothetical protein
MVEQKNHRSAVEHKAAVEQELVDQINKGHYIVAAKKPTITSALAAIPKDESSVRIIHDGSRPIGSAMNDYSGPVSVKFQTLTEN